MKIVLIGQSWLATETLKELVHSGYRPQAVLPDKEDRFANTARAYNIPVVDDLNDFPECDVALAAHCHRYIPAKIMTRSKYGILAYHPSLLPRHRGRDAVHWTIAMRDPIAGGSVYVMDKGVDTGEIVSQEWCHVLPSDTPQTLWRRELGPIGVRLLLNVVKNINKYNMLKTTPQQREAATWEPGLARQKLE